MSLLETNIIILNNGQKAKFSHSDNWYRKVYDFEDGFKAVLLDNQEFYLLSSMGEPSYSLDVNFQPKDIEIYRFDDQVMSVEDWENYFEPIHEDESDKIFPFYKDAWKYAEDKFSNKPYQHIWSIVDGENGHLILLNGYHKVNVLDYLVCKIPWGLGEDSDIDVYLEVNYEGN